MSSCCGPEVGRSFDIKAESLRAPPAGDWWAWSEDPCRAEHSIAATHHDWVNAAVISRTSETRDWSSEAAADVAWRCWTPQSLLWRSLCWSDTEAEGSHPASYFQQTTVLNFSCLNFWALYRYCGWSDVCWGRTIWELRDVSTLHIRRQIEASFVVCLLLFWTIINLKAR